MTLTEREALDREVIAWTREPDWQRDDERFAALALRLFAHQYAHCAPYAAFCRARGRTPETVHDWREVPCVPTGGFKELALASFPLERELARFETSGTTTSARGVLHLDTLAVYEASLEPAFRRSLLPDLPRGARAALRVLAPSAREAPRSSLSHMFDAMLARVGAEASGHWVVDGALDWPRIERELPALAAREEILLLCGTAFAFVHLCDGLEARGLRVALPSGARVMETGGFKGRSRELSREALWDTIGAALGVPHARIVNQYGMTELGSQFYDSALAQPEAARHKIAPPWTRVRLLDAEGREAAAGEVGRIAIADLANTGSVAFVETADLGRRVGEGFELIGREPGAEQRGCSIAADALLARA